MKWLWPMGEILRGHLHESRDEDLAFNKVETLLKTKWKKNTRTQQAPENKKGR